MNVTDWPHAACARLQGDGVVVRVLVAEVLGSAPREPGAWMLVTPDSIDGTIGGGNLEWQAIETARELLNAPRGAPSVLTRRLTLARDAGQCCGGVVQLWIERFTHADLPLLRRAADAAIDTAPVAIETHIRCGDGTRSLTSSLEASASRVTLTTADDGRMTLLERIDSAHTPIWLYGAGHVGQALVRALAGLPYDITWLDSRAGLFPAGEPRVVHVNDPLAAVDRAPRSARHVVMTHDHGLDYDLCRAILTRNAFGWLGLIGSASKAARFRSRLRRDGVPTEQIARLVCPIGMTDIPSKLPAAIAIGIAAQLLRDDVRPAAAGQADCDEDCARCHSIPRTLP
jgi:xanthine dehydrogenase accessory factor